MRDYGQKLIVVTGASDGLGRELARALGRAGAELALVSRNRDALTQLSRELGSLGIQPRAFPFDLTRIDGIAALMADIRAQFGRNVDVLLHCAGSSCYGEIEHVPFEEMRKVWDVNFVAGVRLVQEVLGAMKERRQGQIIWIGSGCALRGIPRVAAYSAAKAAAKNFCEAIRGELRDFNVDVCWVMPGALKTKFHRNQVDFSSDHRLRSPGPVSDPGTVAESIVRAAASGRATFTYGRRTWAGGQLAYWAPSVLDWLLRRQLRTGASAGSVSRG